jgi:hypothetical protein
MTCALVCFQYPYILSSLKQCQTLYVNATGAICTFRFASSQEGARASARVMTVDNEQRTLQFEWVGINSTTNQEYPTSGHTLRCVPASEEETSLEWKCSTHDEFWTLYTVALLHRVRTLVSGEPRVVFEPIRVGVPSSDDTPNAVDYTELYEGLADVLGIQPCAA